MKINETHKQSEWNNEKEDITNNEQQGINETQPPSNESKLSETNDESTSTLTTQTEPFQSPIDSEPSIFFF